MIVWRRTRKPPYLEWRGNHHSFIRQCMIRLHRLYALHTSRNNGQLYHSSSCLHCHYTSYNNSHSVTFCKILYFLDHCQLKDKIPRASRIWVHESLADWMQCLFMFNLQTPKNNYNDDTKRVYWAPNKLSTWHSCFLWKSLGYVLYFNYIKVEGDIISSQGVYSKILGWILYHTSRYLTLEDVWLWNYPSWFPSSESSPIEQLTKVTFMVHDEQEVDILFCLFQNI